MYSEDSENWMCQAAEFLEPAAMEYRVKLFALLITQPDALWSLTSFFFSKILPRLTTNN